MSKHAHISRARRHGVEYEVFDDAEIFERDFYICQTCGIKTDPTKKPPEKTATTLGHRYCMAAGNPHTRANCMCQCWGCNEHQNHTQDTPVVAKIKRIRRKHFEPRVPKRIWPSQALKGAGFQNHLRKKLNGDVVTRSPRRSTR